MIDLGLILAFLTVLGWGAFDVSIRIAVSSFDAHPIIFTCIAQMTGGTLLLLAAGPGKLAIDTIKAPETWIHGFMQVITTATFALGVVYITATEANLLHRVDVFFSMVLAWIFLSRKPSKTDLIGTIIILLCIVPVVWNFDSSFRWVATSFIFLSAFVHVIRTIEAEIHPTSNKANNNIKDRCRVTGVVLMVMSLFFLILYAIFSLVSLSAAPDQMQALAGLSSLLPSANGILDKKSIISGIIVGVFVLAPLTYVYLYAAIKAKTEKLILVASLVTFFAFAAEFTLAKMGLTDISTISALDLILGSIIVGASFWMVYMRQKRVMVV